MIQKYTQNYFSAQTKSQRQRMYQMLISEENLLLVFQTGLKELKTIQTAEKVDYRGRTIWNIQCHDSST